VFGFDQNAKQADDAQIEPLGDDATAFFIDEQQLSKRSLDEMKWNPGKIRNVKCPPDFVALPPGYLFSVVR
jgi:hypothetical protein